MPTTTNVTTCSPTGNGLGVLPANPFLALRYHFGMLLGVDDFETEQAYHRGKIRLHNAWLHRQGVVWGFDVALPERPDEPGTLVGEVRVEPGLAFDAAGHGLHLETAACMDVGAWFEEHQEDAELEVEETENGIRFDAHVVVRFRACLTRPVPALSEPCEGAAADTAYSRSIETVEILMRPGRAPPREAPYHRLRLLFRLEEPHLDDDDDPLPADQEVLDARASILALATEEQPAAYLEAFRRFAALDQIDLEPETAPEGGSHVFPMGDSPPVVLAELTDIELERVDERWILVSAELDRTVRPAHVATATIQELLCGPLFALAAPPDEDDEEPEEPDEDGEEEPEDGGEEPEDDEEEPEDGEEAAASEFGPVTGPATPGEEPEDRVAAAVEDANGPRVEPGTITVTGRKIQLRVDRPLSSGSVHAAAFVVSSYDRTDGWQAVDIELVRYNRGRQLITIRLAAAPPHDLLRITARGTGDRPLIGTDLVPLAGSVAGPASGPHDGRDFVFMLKRR